MIFERPQGRTGFVLIIVVAFLAAAILVPAGCGTKAPDRGPYLVLYAFAEEGQLIGHHMTMVGTSTQLGRKVIRGRVSGKEIVLGELGIGMANAAMMAQRMIDLYRPRGVIVTGIAGAIDSSVQIGDITVCQSWAEHDYGYIGTEGFRPGQVAVVLADADSLVRVSDFPVDSAMLAAARGIDPAEITLDVIGNRTPQLLVGGAGVSGNTFIDNTEKRLFLSRQFEAMVTDMESAAVAHVCAVNGVPFIAFRSASDLAGGSGSETATEELDQFFRIAAANSSKVVMRFLEKL